MLSFMIYLNQQIVDYSALEYFLWQHRKLTLMGKITVIKKFALPKLIYPFTVLLDPERSYTKNKVRNIFLYMGLETG